MVRILETARKRSSIPLSSLENQPGNRLHSEELNSAMNSSEIESLSSLSDASSSDRLSRSNSEHATQSPPQPVPIELRDTIQGGRRIPASYQIREALEFALKKANRDFIVEVQFNGIPGSYHHNEGWAMLMDPPPFAKKEVVREFYGNFSQAPGDIIYVRGINVDIQAARWREFLGLQPVHADYEEELKGRFPQRIGGLMVAIEENLCEETMFWNYDDAGSPISFPFICLKSKWRGWFKWLCNNLMPTINNNVVTMKRAILLLAIQQGV